jgi:hypothetical protein
MMPRYSCRHGHFECSNFPQGPCGDELASEAEAAARKHKYKPGPWTESMGKSSWIVASDGSLVAYVPFDREYAFANARLIAAAPELLVALQGLERTVCQYLNGDKNEGALESRLELTRAVITKAVDT